MYIWVVKFKRTQGFGVESGEDRVAAATAFKALTAWKQTLRGRSDHYEVVGLKRKRMITIGRDNESNSGGS